MLNKIKKYTCLLITGLCFGVFVPVQAQAQSHLAKVRTLVERGDSLRMAYSFEASLDAYEDALQQVNSIDSLESLLYLEVQDKILMSENGLSMTRFVDIPNVVARQKFSIEDFFLYFPLQNNSWRRLPNQLDSSANHALARASFIRNQDKTLYWSAPDSEGIRNIYTSTVNDSVWTLPSLVNEQMTSASDEIYPMLSPDGKSLFFSSSGLYGVGGYDIYVSRWNQDIKDWDAPVNLGFPYSSPADDFLYIDTEDGRYSLFASNRGCAKDSVWVYALEFNNVPVRRSVDDPAELAELAGLVPSYDSTASRGAGVSKTSEIQEYISKVSEIKELKDSIAYYAAYVAEGGSAQVLNQLKTSLSHSLDRIHQIEMKFLAKGVVLDPDTIISEGSEQPVVSDRDFKFVRNEFGPALDMVFEVPEVKFDYSFKVLDVAQYAEDQTLPSGIVYQIQIFASKKKAALKALKGLSPVYMSNGANGHIVYRVGLFRTYSDVLDHVNTVKKLGFRNAFIAAFIDGKSVTVAKARAKEKEKPAVQELYEVRIAPERGELDSGVAAGIRQQSAGKDIARTVGGDGVVRYVVGPFADKSKAEDLALFVKAMGVSDVVCGVVKK